MKYIPADFGQLLYLYEEITGLIAPFITQFAFSEERDAAAITAELDREIAAHYGSVFVPPTAAFGSLADYQSRLVYVRILRALSSAYPDYDLGVISPDSFRRVSADEIRASFAMCISTYAQTRLPELETALWAPLGEEVGLWEGAPAPRERAAQMWSYSCADRPFYSTDPVQFYQVALPVDADPAHDGALWSYMWVCYTTRKRRVLVFAANSKPYVPLNALPWDYENDYNYDYAEVALASVTESTVTFDENRSALACFTHMTPSRDLVISTVQAVVASHPTCAPSIDLHLSLPDDTAQLPLPALAAARPVRYIIACGIDVAVANNDILPTLDSLVHATAPATDDVTALGYLHPCARRDADVPADAPCYVLAHTTERLPEYEYVSSVSLLLRGDLEPAVRAVLGRVQSLGAWRRDYRFCCRCGAPCTHRGAAAVCTKSCGPDTFPPYAPAVIGLVINENLDRCLAIERPGNRFRPAVLTCVAGYVNRGEQPVAAFVREVREEAGVIIDVNNVYFVGTQSWPGSNSLMLSYVAVVSDEALNATSPDGHEIPATEVQNWMNIEAALRGEEGALRLELPNPAAIATQLYKGWVEAWKVSEKK